MNIFQSWWHHIARGAAKGALRALGKLVEEEKRDAPEYEMLDAREEVKIEVSVFSADIHFTIKLFSLRLYIFLARYFWLQSLYVYNIFLKLQGLIKAT